MRGQKMAVRSTQGGRGGVTLIHVFDSENTINGPKSSNPSKKAWVGEQVEKNDGFVLKCFWNNKH